MSLLKPGLIHETVIFRGSDNASETYHFYNYDAGTLTDEMLRLKESREAKGWRAVAFSPYGAVEYERVRPAYNEFFNPAGTWMDRVSVPLLYRLWKRRGKPGIFIERPEWGGVEMWGGVEILHIVTPYGDVKIIHGGKGSGLVESDGLYFKHPETNKE